MLPALLLAATACADLSRLRFPNTTITGARTVAGTFVPPQPQPSSPEFFAAYDQLPPFCRVEATLTPSRDSHIDVEVWLPQSHWNGRFLGVGNGGLGGSIPYFRLGESVNAGYAVAATDTGHKGGPRDAAWANGHPEKQTDFDYRAIHETAVLAKALIRAFYGKPQEHAYFSSCSNGGRQGLMEAERFPDDYDGVMAGAPALSMGFKTFVSGNFDAFRARGGKIVIDHGELDQPQSSTDLYHRLELRYGRIPTADFVRLYIVPGMHHCGGGAVPNDFGQWIRPDADPQHSMLKSLERWVEKKEPPDCIIATQWKIDGDASSGVLRTGKLCPYVAHGAAWQPPPGHTQIPLWPSTVPGAETEWTSVGGSFVAGRPWLQIHDVSAPTMTVYPPKGQSTGAAVIVFPGGGYQLLAIDLEGTEVCDWATAKGMTCVVLKYRVPNAGPAWDQECGCDRDTHSSMPLEDAQRTIALVRSHAAQWHIDPHKIGVLGFSAGGHLVAAVSTHDDHRVYRAVDAADQVSLRPDFAVALYPGHLFIDGALNREIHVTRNTPPTFLLQARNDPVDDVRNSEVYYEALKKAGAPAELHVYAEGGHAFGLRRTKSPITAWPQLVETWLRSLGVMSTPAPAHAGKPRSRAGARRRRAPTARARG
jgi:acetyl esterase/lipase